MTFILVGIILALIQLSAFFSVNWSLESHLASMFAVCFYAVPGIIIVFITWRVVKKQRPTSNSPPS